MSLLSKNQPAKFVISLFIALFMALGASSLASAAPAVSSVSSLKKINSYEYKVLKKNFTGQQINALDSMATDQEISQLVAVIQNPNAAVETVNQPRLMVATYASSAPNGCSYSPDSFGSANFKPTCDAHDLCYSDFSTTDRIDCDKTFLQGLLAECSRVYTGIKRSTCNVVANTYYTAVRTVGGSFYEGQGSAA